MLEEESLDLVQIKSVLGERMYPVPESIRDVIREAEEAVEKNNEEKDDG